MDRFGPIPALPVIGARIDNAGHDGVIRHLFAVPVAIDQHRRRKISDSFSGCCSRCRSRRPCRPRFSVAAKASFALGRCVADPHIAVALQFNEQRFDLGCSLQFRRSRRLNDDHLRRRRRRIERLGGIVSEYVRVTVEECAVVSRVPTRDLNPGSKPCGMSAAMHLRACDLRASRDQQCDRESLPRHARTRFRPAGKRPSPNPMLTLLTIYYSDKRSRP